MPSQAELDAQNNASRARQQARREIEQPAPQMQQPYVNPYGGQYGTDSIQDQDYYNNYYDDEGMTDEEWSAYLAGLEEGQGYQEEPSYYSDYGSRMPDGPIEASYPEESSWMDNLSFGADKFRGKTPFQQPDWFQKPIYRVSNDLNQFSNAQQEPEAETPFLQYLQKNTEQSQGGGANQMEQGSAGSPQSNYYDFVQRGGQMNDEQLRQANEMAMSMGTTFDPETGYSRQPYQDYQEQGPQVQAPMSISDTRGMLQAEREALANRPGYGYGGAVNDQYQSADFDTISRGIFDTPMTGMRPINSETGEPLSQGVIDAAARAGLELPMGSVPLPKAPVNSVPMGQDETRARLGGRTLNEYLNAPDGAVSGLRTDPQGRMIPSRGRAAQDGVFAYDDMTRADAYGQYEDEVSQAYQRQSERMQQRADQRDGTAGPRTYGGYTTAQLRGMVGGGDNLRAAQMRAEAGLNPVTGNREKTAEERQLSTDILNAQLNKLEKSEPNKYNSAVSEVESLVASGILPADKSREAILSKLGYDLEELLGIDGTGAGGGGGSFTEAQQSSISKVMAANPGSSREQIIAEMKKQGKL